MATTCAARRPWGRCAKQAGDDQGGRVANRCDFGAIRPTLGTIATHTPRGPYGGNSAFDPLLFSQRVSNQAFRFTAAGRADALGPRSPRLGCGWAPRLCPAQAQAAPSASHRSKGCACLPIGPLRSVPCRLSRRRSFCYAVVMRRPLRKRGEELERASCIRAMLVLVTHGWHLWRIHPCYGRP